MLYFWKAEGSRISNMTFTDQTRPDQTTLTTFPLPLKIDDCEFFGFQNFKKFHYWVRHAKCTWSSFIYLYPCNKCLASAKKGIRFLWSSVSLLSRAICHRAQIASLNQPACRLEYKSWRKKLNTCLFYSWYISWLLIAQETSHRPTFDQRANIKTCHTNNLPEKCFLTGYK